MTETACRASQILWIITRQEKYLVELYKDVQEYTKQTLNKWCAVKQFYMQEDRYDQVVCDATSLLIENYLKKPNFYILSFKKQSIWYIKHALGHSYQTHHGKKYYSKEYLWDHHTSELGELLPCASVTEYDNSKWWIDDILSEPFGANVIFDLYHYSKSYKQTILHIATYKSKQWIYDHATQLHTIHIYIKRSRLNAKMRLEFQNRSRNKGNIRDALR